MRYDERAGICLSHAAEDRALTEYGNFKALWVKLVRADQKCDVLFGVEDMLLICFYKQHLKHRAACTAI